MKSLKTTPDPVSAPLFSDSEAVIGPAKSNSDEPRKRVLLMAQGREFLVPYLEREMPDCEFVNCGSHDYAVCIISPDESIPADLPAEATVLRCPNIVGTHMTGFPRLLAEAIAEGRYFHLLRNEARLSTIHATDVAQAVRLSLGTPGQYTVTDLDDPTYRDFTDALAHRIKDKRILTIRVPWLKFLLAKSIRKVVTEDKTVSGRDFAEKFNFKPTPVVQYLHTHVYDDESL